MNVGCQHAGHDYRIVYLTLAGDRYVWVCRFCGLRVAGSGVVEFQRERKALAGRSEA